jgi:hypothetical protein
MTYAGTPLSGRPKMRKAPTDSASMLGLADQLDTEDGGIFWKVTRRKVAWNESRELTNPYGLQAVRT